jgi:hypothetical protein
MRLRPSQPRPAYRLPIRNWESLDSAVRDMDRRLTRLEARNKVLIAAITTLGTTAAAIAAVLIKGA